MTELLIIEDSIEEANIAQQTAESLGIETKLIQDFKSALDEIRSSKLSAIASDLFFPAGDINQEPYIQQVLPAYEAYSRGFKRIDDQPLARALRQVANIPAGITKEEAFENIRELFLRSHSERDIESHRDAWFGIEFYSKYAKLKEHIEGIKQGSGIPYGIFVVQKAEELDIPVHIITSTNHHDVAFEPVRNKIGDYSDNLVEGHKDWKAGIERLLAQQK